MHMGRQCLIIADRGVWGAQSNPRDRNTQCRSSNGSRRSNADFRPSAIGPSTQSVGVGRVATFVLFLLSSPQVHSASIMRVAPLAAGSPEVVRPRVLSNLNVARDGTPKEGGDHAQK